MTTKLDLKGEVLSVATNLSPPYVFMDYLPHINRWNLTSGFEVKLLEALSSHFNFTYRVINCNNDWGVLDSNHNWTGIIGAVVQNDADIGFGGVTITYERSQAVYFTEPHIITSVSFITPPPKNKPKVTLVMEPFDVMVWVCVVVSMLLMLSIEALIVHKWVQYRTLHIKWGIICALLKQTSCCRPPNIVELRVLLYFWLLACLVLTSSYSGCLHSLMAVPSKVIPIKELVDLAAEQRSGRIKVTAIGGSSYYESLKAATFGVYKELGEYLLPVEDKEAGLDVVRKGDQPTAYISTRDHLMYGFLKFGSRSLYLPPATQESTLFVDIMGIAIRKDFKERKTFNKMISNLKKGGFLDYWRLSEMRKLVSTSQDQSIDLGTHYREYRILHLEQLQSAIYLFMFGQSVAILLIFIEMIIKFRKFNLPRLYQIHSEESSDDISLDNKNYEIN